MSITTKILWIVYICLLGVLLPHTAWAFASMEPAGGEFTAWVAAIAFESAIAVLTHKLAKHIEANAKAKGRFHRFSVWYLNPFALGLGLATLVSAMANLAHAVEFGTALVIFDEWGIPPGLYSVAFGGILPFVSLIFARVLSNVVDTETSPNPELEQAKQALADVRKQLRESEHQRTESEHWRIESEGRANSAEEHLFSAKSELEQAKQTLAKITVDLRNAEDRARLAEERFGAMGDLFRRIFSDDKRERILAVREWRPALPGSAIALITEASPSYVSEVLNNTESVNVESEQGN